MSGGGCGGQGQISGTGVADGGCDRLHGCQELIDLWSSGGGVCAHSVIFAQIQASLGILHLAQLTTAPYLAKPRLLPFVHSSLACSHSFI